MGNNSRRLACPDAQEAYRMLREEPWLEPFLQSEDRALRRLGAMLVVDEVKAILEPEREAARIERDRRADARDARRL